MKLLHRFQTTLETIRSHHWRYYTDVYLGCYFNCLYCLYRGNTSCATDIKVKVDIPQLLSELKTEPKGVLYIGATTDPYQPAEKEYNCM